MAFSWSFSKLKNFEDCAYRHEQCDLTKGTPQEDSDELRWGNYVHDKLAAACKDDPKLPEDLEPYQKWVDKVRSWKGGTLYVEQKYAVTRTLKACNWIAPGVWFRTVADLVYVNGPLAVTWDWKTGKIQDNSVQLGIVAQAVFSNFPDVQKVLSQYIWLKEDCAGEPELMSRSDLKTLWTNLLPRVSRYEYAVTQKNFPKKPGGLCKRYCPVTKCEFHGRGSR
jgi:hypothetical protein